MHSEVGHSSLPSSTQEHGGQQGHSAGTATLEVVMMKHLKLKKVAYVVAIRPLGGGNKWTFLDSGAFTEKPELLYLFLPKLERGVVPPPNRIQRAG